MNSLNKNGSNGRNSSSMKLYVRYMVSLRCESFAKTELKKLGVEHQISFDGGIKFPDGISTTQCDQLKINLKKGGLQLLDESESILIDRIIGTIIEIVHHTDHLPRVCFNELIHDKLGSDSESILRIFSEVKGVSITQYIVQQKIERAKELLLYYDYSINEISDKLNYKNEDLFVSQFKKYTDLTPSYFLDLKDKRSMYMAYQ